MRGVCGERVGGGIGAVTGRDRSVAGPCTGGREGSPRAAHPASRSGPYAAVLNTRVLVPVHGPVRMR
ncbi:hypothetical protein GCM10027564_13790 [Luteimonas notoginsengisoli]